MLILVHEMSEESQYDQSMVIDTDKMTCASYKAALLDSDNDDITITHEESITCGAETCPHECPPMLVEREVDVWIEG